MVAANSHFPESPSGCVDWASACVGTRGPVAKHRTVIARLRVMATFIVELLMVRVRGSSQGTQSSTQQAMQRGRQKHSRWNPFSAFAGATFLGNPELPLNADVVAEQEERRGGGGESRRWGARTGCRSSRSFIRLACLGIGGH